MTTVTGAAAPTPGAAPSPSPRTRLRHLSRKQIVGQIVL